MVTINDQVYIVIPVYNEEQVIATVIRNTQKYFKNIVCVDDGSKDNSASEIKKTSAYLVRHPINMGQGAALQTGIEFARSFNNAKYFVTFDADGQHRVDDVMAMVKELKKGKSDIILGSRFLGQEAENMPKLKRIILRLAIKFSNITSGVKLTDTHNGLRVFNRHVAENVQITMSDMAHASEFLEIIREKQFRYTEVPVKIVYTDYSRGKGQSILNAVNIAFDVLLKRIAG
jgi:polyprenyl-phospho-N-acetylgalactosaminyl synthase